MEEMYKGLANSGLAYIDQSIQVTQGSAMSLLSYTDTGFTSFKSGLLNYNNGLPDSSFTAVTINSPYSKAVHDNTLTYTHNNISYTTFSLQEASLNEEVTKLNSYLLSTNQEIPTELQTMIDNQSNKFINKNLHQNAIIDENNPQVVTIENGLSLTAYNKGEYIREYSSRGNISYSRWSRHGNYSAYTQSYSNYSNYGDYSQAYDRYSRYNRSYSRYTQYMQYSQQVPSGYDKTTYPVKQLKQFAPTQPQLYAQNVLTDMQNTVTLGYYSYDRNTKTGESAWSNVRYKVELCKTSGPNQRAWTTIQDSFSDKITLNPRDPFGIGWTQTSQGYGNYSIRITPYNVASSFTDAQGYTFSSAQVTGTPLQVNFNIQVNSVPTLTADGNTSIINSILYMDGAVRGNNSFNYADFYGTSVSSETNHGVYLALTVRDADIGQYLKAMVVFKDRATGAQVATSNIIWGNGSEVIQNTNGIAMGYVYAPSSLFKDKKFDGQLEIHVTDYYENPSSASVGAISTLRQNFVGGGNTTLLNVDFDMQKTLNYDVAEIKQSGKLTVKPRVEVAVNQQAHLRESLGYFKYEWSTSPTPSGNWKVVDGSTLSVEPPSEGIWYLHQIIGDKYGKTLSNMTGPVFYSDTQLTLSAPTALHFDDSDRLKVIPNIASKPNINVTYQYRYGYRKAGSSTEFTYSDWSSSLTILTDYLNLYDGVEIITEARIVEVGEIVQSPTVTITLADKLSWCIKNQQASNYNIESTSAPEYNKHNTEGYRTDGYKLVITNKELQDTLREEEYYYYKLVNGTYTFKRIIYFVDPI